MSKPTVIARGALAAATAALALAGVAAPAAAQPYGYYAGPPSYSDVCRSDRNTRTALGTLLGAGIGAVLGSQIAANHHRTDGSIAGGVVGAIGGGAIGRSSAQCDQGYAPPPPPPAPPPRAYVEPPPPAYYHGRYEDDRWAYGRGGEHFRIVDRPVGPDGCALAESPIYMPDGRVQKRFVRVCMDSSGRYQVVD